MSRYAYVNGAFVRHRDAAIHIEDRGYQLSDGVYEVWAVMDGKLADPEGHFARLWRSLDELRIAHPMSRAALTAVLREVVRRNRVKEGLLYLQVTRGVARRDHAFPNPEVAPAVTATIRPVDRVASEAKAAKGYSAVTVPENRWGRCDIKSVALLPNALAKQAAREQGALEAFFVDELGFVTEGASSNAWIVDQDGSLRTRDTQANILRGVTRGTLLQVMAEQGLTVNERPFTVAEAQAARECFISGAGSLVSPIVSIDGKPVGDGEVGPLATTLRALYIQRARETAI